MKLGVETRTAGNFVVVRCQGRIVAGEEVIALEEKIKAAFDERMDVAVNLVAVQMLDSSGLGALVRLVSLARMGHRQFRLCCLPAPVQRLLEMTKLRPIFDLYETEEAALSSSETEPRQQHQQKNAHTKLVCVDASRNLLSYLENMLKAEGFQVSTANNYPDAMLLLKSPSTRMVLFGPNELTCAYASSTQALRSLVPDTPIVMVQEKEDAAEMAAAILKEIGERMATRP